MRFRAGGFRAGGLAPLLGLIVFVFGLSLYANLSSLVQDPESLRFFPPFLSEVNLNANRHLGDEHLRIAQALASGRGFSDPFRVDGGPTAWMPPVYPFFLAGLILLLGSTKAVAMAVLLAKNAVLVGTGLLVHRAAAGAARLPAGVALGAYCVWLLAHFWWFFQFTHDVWILLLCVDLCLLGAWRLLARSGGWRAALAWGGLGGGVFLTGPITGLAWLALTGFLARRRALLRPMLGAALLALALTSVWGVRNWLVFERLIFVKSNVYFDLYQANYISADGVYDEPFFDDHPLWTTSRDADSLYRREGEVAFLDGYRDRFFEAVRLDPAALLRKSGNRFLAATLVYKPYRPQLEGARPLLRSAIHALPFLGLLALLALRRRSLDDRIRVAILLYATTLAAYTVSAFYIRYLLPLTPVLVLLWFWGADALCARIAPRTGAAS